MKTPTIVALCVVCSIPLGLCGGCLTLAALSSSSYKQRERIAPSAPMQTQAAEDTTPRPTQANYLKLQIGMTYDQVVAIVGEPTEELSRMAIGENESVVYLWKASTFGGNMNATFGNGKLVSKAQFGLPH